MVECKELENELCDECEGKTVCPNYRPGWYCGICNGCEKCRGDDPI